MTDHVRRLIGLESLADAARWTGEGEVVGIVDSGIDESHPDFSGRLRACDAVASASEHDVWGHGTHVAGIVAGDGTASGGKLRGMAPAAQLVILGIVSDERKLMLPVDIGTLLHRVADMGAQIINLSWRSAISSAYESGAMAVDTFMRERRDVLVVIAAGNDGTAPHGHPMLGSVGAPAISKNALTVGACCSDRRDFAHTWGSYRQAKFPSPPTSELPLTGNPDLPAAFSSRGPNDWHGLVPDLLAPGTAVLAPRASDAQDRQFWQLCSDYEGRYAYDIGTSMSAPVASGAAAVIRQYLREELNMPSPSAALVKALLVASSQRIPWSRGAEDEPRIGYPDFDQGHGRLNLAKIMPAADTSPHRRLSVRDIGDDSDWALESRAPAGSAQAAVRGFRFKIREGCSEPVRIVLAWSDYSVRSIQNGLRLIVQGPDACQRAGNPDHRWLMPALDDLDPTFPPDCRNNVQRVDLPVGLAGTCRVRLIAGNTLFGPQGYALAVCGELDEDLEDEQ